MDNSIYITLSRQLALFRDMDVTANNIANMNTSGYTANQVLFNSYMVKDGKRGGMDFAHDISVWRDTSSGTMRTTGNTLDIAIGGEGYFMVDSPAGRRYTRAGNFEINAEGNRVTPEGYAVLDTNGQRITFTTEDKDLGVGELGNITVDGEERATIGIVTFENPQALERKGERMFASEEEGIPATDPRVMQGVLENSNVQAVREMTHMIEVSRGVGSTAKFIEVMYDLQRKSTAAWTQQT